jgi:hypothetical protein
MCHQPARTSGAFSLFLSFAALRENPKREAQAWNHLYSKIAR